MTNYINIINHLAENNEKGYNEHKLLEELAELNEVLIKRIVKKGTDKEPSEEHLVEEMGDVLIRIEVLAKQLEVSKFVSQRYDNKLTKYQEYIETGKYKGRI